MLSQVQLKEVVAYLKQVSKKTSWEVMEAVCELFSCYVTKNMVEREYMEAVEEEYKRILGACLEIINECQGMEEAVAA